MARCEAHSYEQAVRDCDDCHRPMCTRCAVPVKKKTLCMNCALVRAGIRRRPAVMTR
jgi:hypothetical protein